MRGRSVLSFDRQVLAGSQSSAISMAIHQVTDLLKKHKYSVHLSPHGENVDLVPKVWTT
jgi:hypothetical protein